MYYYSDVLPRRLFHLFLKVRKAFCQKIFQCDDIVSLCILPLQEQPSVRLGVEIELNIETPFPFLHTIKSMDPKNKIENTASHPPFPAYSPLSEVYTRLIESDVRKKYRKNKTSIKLSEKYKIPEKIISLPKYENVSLPKDENVVMDIPQFDDINCESELPVLRDKLEDELIHTLKAKTPFPENHELFCYTSDFFYRIAGKYIVHALSERNESQSSVYEKEVERLRQNSKLTENIHVMKHLSLQFHQAIQVTISCRLVLARILFRIEHLYSRLFEETLVEVLRMNWHDQKKHEEQLKEAEIEVPGLTSKIVELETYIKRLNQTVEDEKMLCKSYEARIQLLEIELNKFKEKESQYAQIEKERLALQWLKNDKNKSIEEHSVNGKQFDSERKVLLEEKKELEAKIQQMYKERLFMEREIKRKLYKQNKETNLETNKVVKKLKCRMDNAETQTEVDENGLWDEKDGIPIYVSRSLAARIAWKKFTSFIACKNCRGRPFPETSNEPTKRMEYMEEEKDFRDVWTALGEKKKRKQMEKSIQWHIPYYAKRFLSNIPKSIMATEPQTLEKTEQQIQLIYDDKFIADELDLRDGVALHDLMSFVLDCFLECNGTRQLAEIEIYRFFISLKEWYKRSPSVNLCVRFLGLLDDGKTKSTLNLTAVSLFKSLRSHSKVSFLSLGLKRDENLDGHKDKENSCVTYLDQKYLRVYLRVRSYLKELLAEGEPYVVLVEEKTMYIQLDYAATLLKPYVKFLSEDDRHIFMRQLEYNACILTPNNTIAEMAGTRLAVRAQMHKIENGKTENETDDKQPQIVLHREALLELILCAFQLKSKNLQNEIVQVFAAGDTNGDGVLTFQEFYDILQKRSPNITQRHALRMFREALTEGNDQSFAISIEAFVKVCERHGVISFLELTEKVPLIKKSDSKLISI